MSTSEQQIILGKGFPKNLLFSVYSASMVGVFCALILMVDSAWPALCALVALLASYLLTCIFIFGGFRRFSRDGAPGYQLGLPSGFVILFCVTSLAALFGTYSALDPIAGARQQVSALPKPGTVTLRFKQSDQEQGQARQASPQQPVKHVEIAKSPAAVPVVEDKTADVKIAFDAEKPILASVRSDDLVGVRTVRSHAWAVRESAELPLFLRLPSILFSILYGDDVPAPAADMVIAKQATGSSARIMVSFLTTPAQSFKNHPSPRAGGTLVVRKREARETVVARSPAVAPSEAITVVQKSEPEANTTTTVVAQVEPVVARQDPIAVAGSKQDLQKVASLKPTAARTPDVLLPPVLASIFYGPSRDAKAVKTKKRAPRLTTLFKTDAPQAVPLLTSDPVTVVAKSADTPPVRHPIALAALADNHRMDPASTDGLGGPFSSVLGKRTETSLADADPSTQSSSLVTGSIPSKQIDSALRSLRFAPQASKARRQIKRQPTAPLNNAKSDYGAVQALAPQNANAAGRGVPAGTTDRAVTTILKKEAAAPRPRQKVALAAAPEPGLSAKQNALSVSRSDRVKDPDTAEFAKEAPKTSGEAPLSAEAMRKANEEINSALRGAEDDLKDTDEVLEDIDVIWGDFDKKKTSKRRPAKPDTKASVEPTPAVGTLVIKPASGSDANISEARSTVPIRLVLKLKEAAEPPSMTTIRKSPPRSAKTEDRELLGYITEQETVNQHGKFSRCAVLGANSKLRACRGHSVTKL